MRSLVVVCNQTRTTDEGTVLGPKLFLLYIIDIGSCCCSTMRLFADNAMLYRNISASSDHVYFLRDFQNLESWAKLWQISFNVTKCKLLSITNKKRPSNFDHYLNSQHMSSTDECNYLGVKCRRDLRWSSHSSNVCNKANKTLGLLRRIVKPCSQYVKEQAYLTSTMVRPIVELRQLHGIHTRKGM